MSSKKLPIAVAPDEPFSRLLAGDAGAVIDSLRAHIATAGADSISWLRLGIAYLTIEHWREAADALGEAVAIDGSSVEARRMYARALSRLRRHDEAAFQLVQAKRLMPDDAQVLKELAVAFYDKRLYDKALTELRRAQELAPRDARVHFALGLVHEGKRQMADAIASYSEAVRLDPGFAEAHRTLADALAAMGEMAGAVGELEAAQRIQRTDVEIAQNLELLKQGLTELSARCLLGKSEREVERSTLVQEGQLKRKGRVIEGTEAHVCAETVRYAAELAELWLGLDEGGRIRRLALLLPDPARAAREPGTAFQVEVLSRDGHTALPNYATAVTLTFLREALGCPMTTAGELYARLLTDRQALEHDGVRIAFAEVELGGAPLHGIRVEALDQ